MSRVLARLAQLSADDRRALVDRLKNKYNTIDVDRHDANLTRSELVAYFVPINNGMDQAGQVTERIRTATKSRLPSHMQPARVISVDAFPLLPNGKVDLGVLASYVPAQRDQNKPIPDSQSDKTELSQSVAKLVAIVESVLDVEDVLPEDGFFELGGDSIAAIQFVSIARQEGFDLQISEVSDGVTIADLAGKQSSDTAEPTAGIPTGETPLTAIQAWFFAQNHPTPARWNQSGRFSLTQPLSVTELTRIFDAIAESNPQLGSRFDNKDGTWTVEIPDTRPETLVHVLDCAITDSDAIEQVTDQIQDEFDLSTGWMIRFVLVRDVKTACVTDIIWLAHHLIIDAISIAQIARDLNMAIGAITLTDVSTPSTVNPQAFRDWALHMQEVADSTHSGAEEIVVPTTATSSGETRPTEHDCQSLEFTLDPTLVERAFDLAQQASVKPVELLCAALSSAWVQRLKVPRARIDVETHGRDALGSEFHADQIVGWMTSFFPLIGTSEETVGLQLVTIKDGYRHAQNNGRDYLLKRYIAKLADSTDVTTDTPTLLFNYGGRLAAHPATDSTPPVRLMTFHAEQMRAANNFRSHDVELNISSTEVGLTFLWQFVGGTSEDLIGNVQNDITEFLRNAVEHFLADDASTHSLSDFPDASIDQDDLDSLLRKL